MGGTDELTAIVVGVMGGSAFGDHHLEVCSHHAWWCQGECAELNACRSGNTPIGGLDCLTEEFNLFGCEADGPPGIPIVIVPPPPPPPPPPPCPAGQHFAGGECQADHECGDDEIGGGSEECEPCGVGKVPNEDGTACVTCEHGESHTSSGVCAAVCSNDELDSAAALSLMGILKDPWEELESYTCDAHGHMHVKWLGSSEGNDDVCELGASGSTASSAYGHSHPHFTFPRDRRAYCRGVRISSAPVARNANRRNSNFSSKDKRNARLVLEKPMYLVVPERDVVKVYRKGPSGHRGRERWQVEIVQ